LALSGTLAVSSLLGDSINFDEMADLTAGMSHLLTGDFRLSPAHPPLSKMWAALPLLLTEQQWISPDTPGWVEGQTFQVGRAWLCDLNPGERLIIPARCMVVILLLALCWCIYAAGRALFGPRAGLIALLLAAFSPSFLAHGRLVTTDLPLTFLALATLLAFARLFKQVTWGRLAAACLALSCASLVKFSWVLLVPALLLMGVMAVSGPEPIRYSLWLRPARLAVAGQARRRELKLPASRAAAVAVIGLAAAACAWVSIWSCYGWRYSPFRGPDRDRAMMMPAGTVGQPLPTTMAGAWQSVVHDINGRPMHDWGTRLILWARSHRLLPEAYLYGLAYTKRTTEARPAYLMGSITSRGRKAYFPIAFALKTPLPTLLLLAAGLGAVLTGRVSTRREPLLLAGLSSFALLYGAVAVTSEVNIGQRHILPLYPAVMIFAGAAVAWCAWRPARWLTAAAIIWLAGANLYIHPHYLSYFNELAGGAAGGHRYLADSNLDWGQDLKRLARYARLHPDRNIKLAYFGSADPTRYGFDCQLLPCYLPNDAKAAQLTAGTYVISVTQLLGLYLPAARDDYWRNPDVLAAYRNLSQRFAGDGPAAEGESLDRRSERARFEFLRQARLLQRLKHRPPDERIGYSLFVYFLSQADVDELTAP
jgi:hypothetical protein